MRQIRWIAIAAIVSLYSTPSAGAEASWEGTWTPDPALSCVVPESDGAPLMVASSRVVPGIYWQSQGSDKAASPEGPFGQFEFLRAADPYVCYIKKITAIIDLPAWIFDVQCGGEGEIWDSRNVLMLESGGDIITRYDGSSTERMYRCDPSMLLRPYGTNDKYGGNINIYSGRSYKFLESVEPIGERGGTYSVTTLYRNREFSDRSTYIVSCNPMEGQPGIVDLATGEMNPINPEVMPTDFTPELGYFDLWWMTCRGRLDPSSPTPEWSKEIEATLAPIELTQ